MVPEVLRYRVSVDVAGEFVSAYRRAGNALKLSSHCQGFELLRSGKDPELFLLTILWDSPEGHMNGFRKSHEFGPFFAEIKPYLSNLLEMEHYVFTDVSWRRGV